MCQVLLRVKKSKRPIDIKHQGISNDKDSEVSAKVSQKRTNGLGMEGFGKVNTERWGQGWEAERTRSKAQRQNVITHSRQISECTQLWVSSQLFLFRNMCAGWGQGECFLRHFCKTKSLPRQSSSSNANKCQGTLRPVTFFS